MVATTGTSTGTGTGAGRPRTVPRFWKTDSTPFASDGAQQPCKVLLRQVDDNNFALEARLQVRAPAGMTDMPATTLTVETAWLKHCDLASIPGSRRPSPDGSASQRRSTRSRSRSAPSRSIRSTRVPW